MTVVAMSDPGFSPNSHLLAGEMPAPTQKSRWDVLTGGAVVPALIIIIVLFVATRTKVGQDIQKQVAEKFDVVFLEAKKGPGGGGGGRPKDPTPPRKAEILPTKPVEIKPVPKVSIVPPTDMNIPIQTVDAVQTLPGAVSQIDAGVGAAGGGKGTGIGTGNGSGVGPGSGGGFGGGEYQIGNGVTSPELIRDVKPAYTGDAMRAKIQGVVELEAVVMPDGTVDPNRIKITRSLDPHFGLDLEAIKAVKLWRFRPGTFQGHAVPVRVSVELTFTLR